jgi:CRP-like cAMP-binding protein
LNDSHSFYVVASGRLRLTGQQQDGPLAGATEFGKGQSAGALELYMARRRASMLRAIRRSHVLQTQKTSFQALSYNNPSLAFRFSEILAASAPSYIERSSSKTQRSNDDSTIHTVAIVPISPKVVGKEFARSLARAICELRLAGEARPPILDAYGLRKSLPAQSTAIYGESILENYLFQVEDNAPLVLYLADEAVSGYTAWSKICVAHVSRDKP